MTVKDKQKAIREIESRILHQYEVEIPFWDYDRLLSAYARNHLDRKIRNYSALRNNPDNLREMYSETMDLTKLNVADKSGSVTVSVIRVIVILRAADSHLRVIARHSMNEKGIISFTALSLDESIARVLSILRKSICNKPLCDSMFTALLNEGLTEQDIGSRDEYIEATINQFKDLRV